ncbi:MAG: hypothetical protein QG622_1985 [Actinomycetota bacterium]|nr:hypothetical protein [Actinomycetota bacterium]
MRAIFIRTTAYRGQILITVKVVRGDRHRSWLPSGEHRFVVLSPFSQVTTTYSDGMRLASPVATEAKPATAKGNGMHDIDQEALDQSDPALSAEREGSLFDLDDEPEPDDRSAAEATPRAHDLSGVDKRREGAAQPDASDVMDLSAMSLAPGEELDSSTRYDVFVPDFETDELDLAERLLEVRGAVEAAACVAALLDSQAGGGADFARSREGRQLGGILLQAATRILPVLTTAPGRGTRSGGASSLNVLAKRCFGLDLEGMSPEDQEFELARQFIRLAQEAARECRARSGGQAPHQVARAAAEAAGRRWAPGLFTARILEAPPLAPRSDLPSCPAVPNCAKCRNGVLSGVASGWWERSGNKTILYVD